MDVDFYWIKLSETVYNFYQIKSKIDKFIPFLPINQIYQEVSMKHSPLPIFNINPFRTIMAILLFATSHIYADGFNDKNKRVVLIMIDDLMVPLIVEKPKTDRIPPPKPKLAIAAPSSTDEDHITIVIQGETDSNVYINGHFATQINHRKQAVLRLDTSGAGGIKKFYITLRDSTGNISDPLILKINKTSNTKYNTSYKGLTLYHHDMNRAEYKLKQLTDAEFNALNPTQKLEVANTLLSTLFFGYPLADLKKKINQGDFISSLYNGLQDEITDKDWLENYIHDDSIFRQNYKWAVPEVVTILTRFYVMKHLDHYFLKNWITYILTQTILFSPAYELSSVHTEDIKDTYDRIFNFIDKHAGMRYIAYRHMKSEENWRRFRSPEDNGREMLEIFLQDQADAHVPIAAKALQNWKLNLKNDTLEVGSNKNKEPLHLFGTTIYNGDDFYLELVKSSQFTKGVTNRLVDFFFPNIPIGKRKQIANTILASHPETWQDILLQIVFSEEYLLHNKRVKSAEETYYAFTKKLGYLHRRNTFIYFKIYLEKMRQASMKYKLGKLKRVPLDSLSFAYYHKLIRKELFMRASSPDKVHDYDAWARQGWSRDFVKFDKFTYDENDIEQSLDNFVNYIFQAMISREATATELEFFRKHMIYKKNGEKHFQWAFNMFATYNDPDRQHKNREERKINIASLVLDYISRLEETYMQNEVH